MKNTLVLLAGDVGYSRFLLEQRNKALLEINGRILLEHTLTAIASTSQFSELIIVGPADVLQRVPPVLPGGMAVQKVRQAHTVASNLSRALSMRTRPEGLAVIMTADAPLVTAAELDRIAAMCWLTNADILVAVARQQPDGTDFDRAYRRSMVPTKDGAFLLGNLFALRSAALPTLRLLDDVFSLRKQTRQLTQLRTAALVAARRIPPQCYLSWLRIVIAKRLWALFPSKQFPLRSSISLRTLEIELNRLLGNRTHLRLFATDEHGACWDVDTPEQLQLIRHHFAEARAATTEVRKHA